MPVSYIALHLLFTALCVLLALRLPPRSWIARLLGAALFLLVASGLVVERRTDWAWSAMLLRWPGAVFMVNLTLEGVAVLLAILWRSAPDRPARVRAVALSVVILGACLKSYEWYFAPLPEGLNGTVDATGYCGQTTDDSCGAAAAAMLLHHYGIPATEREMAALCLTRQGHGTTPLGLYRGVALKALRRGFRPALRFVRVGRWEQAAALGGPAIISIGIGGNPPPDTLERLTSYGWKRGVRHAVVLLDADPKGKWLDIADPSYGRERWPTGGLEYLWDGKALVLTQ